MKCSLVSLIFLKRSLVFPVLLFSSISLHWSLRKVFLSLLAILWNCAFRWAYLSFSPLLFTSCLFTLFVRPPQTAILPFCISFSWGWSWSLSPVQCHEPCGCNGAQAQLRSGVVAKRSYPTSEVRGSDWGELPHVQGKRNPSKMVGRGHQRADRLKPQSQTTSQSDRMDYRLV